MKNFLIGVLCLLTGPCITARCFAENGQDKTYSLYSPDSTIEVKLDISRDIKWSVAKRAEKIIAPSIIGLRLDNGETPGLNSRVLTFRRKFVNETLITPFYKKRSVINKYNEYELIFRGNYGLVFRVYNTGVAYRLYTARKKEQHVANEIVNFNFDNNYSGYFPINRINPVKDDRFSSYFESLYLKSPIDQFPKDSLALLPALINISPEYKVVILEAGLENYPGMFLNKSAQNSFGVQGCFAPLPLKEQLADNLLDTKVVKRDSVIAEIPGHFNFPWRVAVISESDKELLDNDIVRQLEGPSRIKDISWIKPGKASWEWWGDWNISKVEFPAGINTKTYKAYIDFAAAHSLEYIIMDEGWSSDTNLLHITPEINLDSIISYGQKKNVGVILWSTIFAIDKNPDSLFQHYSRLGIKGFKIDFFDRDDQVMVRRLNRIAATAAHYQLILDLHGTFKPSGLNCIYPNILNFEGVRGLEWCKGSDETSVPDYDVEIPFIRMLSGPMDYTPGAMRNANRQNFRAIPSMPMSLGTRCHQVAMYILYEAPLQMLADNPTAYQADTICTNFISSIPTVYDETIALDGKVGEYAVVARKKNNCWYIGALNGWTGRDLELSFGFLGEGNFSMQLMADGLNAERDGTDYVAERVDVNNQSKFTIHLAEGGGWACIIKEKK